MALYVENNRRRAGMVEETTVVSRRPGWLTCWASSCNPVFFSQIKQVVPDNLPVQFINDNDEIKVAHVRGNHRVLERAIAGFVNMLDGPVARADVRELLA